MSFTSHDDIAYTSTSQIQTLTEHNIPLYHLHSLINFLLQLTITHQSTHTLHIAHQHVQSHYSLDNHTLWCTRVVDSVGEVKPNRPFVYSVA